MPPLFAAAAALAAAASAGAEPPFRAAALWAAERIPDSCDVRGTGCDWLALPSAWRYVWNNLRLAHQLARPGPENMEPERLRVEESLGQIHRWIDRLGDDPGLWYSNWHRLGTVARAHLNRTRTASIRAGAGARSSFVASAPPADAHAHAGGVPGLTSGLRFPAVGRSLMVTQNSRLPVGPLELPLLGLVVEKDVDETSFVRALQLGVRAFYLSASASALGFSDALLRSGVERRAVLVLGERPSEVLLEADLEVLLGAASDKGSKAIGG
ncbi:unnamed protein product [Durusdinium trenchii]|uniref:Uncharacterized protein n=1 Tax=Durusdinium trenchii TaxID=1381693 RepID=A0ABP0MWJ3_9DINO